ncbi:hypothetical protein [Nitrospirillum amazonense]|uniref:hypothetical protein n=1 Tax=Nitrospirillum amazonense TaxID=28077 RepID=UPI0011A4A869|nr:hypothetical protein [Nitrospirillum amazonense]MDG3443668.1 hypothetical protein [Nitrospirillum amazonense]
MPDGVPGPAFWSFPTLRADAPNPWKKQPDKGQLYTRIIGDIRQLEQSVAALQRTCQMVAQTKELSAFRKLWVEVGDTLSFITVLASRGESLDESKRPATLIRLSQLRQTVTELHIRSVEPVLQAMVDKAEPMGLGTGYVMEKWVTHMDVTAQEVAQSMADLERLHVDVRHAAELAETVPAGEAAAPLLKLDAVEASYEAAMAGYGRLTGAVARSRALAQIIVQSAPALRDFTNDRQEQTVRAYLRGPGDAGALPAPTGGPATGTLYLTRKEGKLYVDPELSSDAVKSLRGGGYMEDLAKRIDLPRHKLTTLLAGRDGINFTFLSKLKTGVEGVTGANGVKVEVLQA